MGRGGYRVMSGGVMSGVREDEWWGALVTLLCRVMHGTECSALVLVAKRRALVTCGNSSCYLRLLLTAVY